MSFVDTKGVSVGYAVLSNQKLTVQFPNVRERSYEIVLSGGRCSAPALGAGVIVISPKDWVLDGGLKATIVYSIPQSGRLLLLDLRNPRRSKILACADLQA